MNCKHVQLSLVAYQDKELSPQETSALEAHLENCRACKATLPQISRTWEILGSLATIEPSSDFKTRFWEKTRQGELKPDLWEWISWPRLVPALAGGMALWVLGIGGGLYLFEHQVPVPQSGAMMSIFTSSYPTNSIEEIYLQGSSKTRGQGGSV